MTTFPAVTVKSDLGKETLYISPVMSPSLPKALAIPSIFSCRTLVWANTSGLAVSTRLSNSEHTNLSVFISSSRYARQAPQFRLSEDRQGWLAFFKAVLKFQ